MKGLPRYGVVAGLATAVLLFSGQALPTGSTSHFAESGVCAVCHRGLADSSGTDVSISADWRSTMMANSARDPLWRAKFYSETIRNPELAEVIEDKCSTCHMPMARSHLTRLDRPVVVWDDGLIDEDHDLHTQAMDGVSCTLCHQILQRNIGTEPSFSGRFIIDATTARPDRAAFGPYTSPLAMPMRSSAGFTPEYSAHVDDSGLCATCHTLYTPVITESGEHVGDFPEQTPYLEWEQSVYSIEGNRSRSCQDCHMPRAAGPVRISNRPAQRLAAREPFFKHFFVGGNTLMLELMSQDAANLGLTSTEQQLETTKARTARQLAENTATIEIARTTRDASTLSVAVKIQNHAGHKFPTGFPSRRAWVHLVVRDSDGTVVFESGGGGPLGSITDNDADGDSESFERHHSVITDTRQVQVYEVIMQDLDGKVTYTLLDASDRIKDNRLLPAGFDKREASPDTAVMGAAVDDEDFEGGSDSVDFVIPLKGAGSPYAVHAELLYQIVSYRFWRELVDDGQVRALPVGELIGRLGEYNLPSVVATARTTVR